MKKLLCLILAVLLILCACGTSAGKGSGYTATQADIGALDAMYEGRTAYHGELHDHSNSGGTSDGQQPLSVWASTMPSVGMDYAAILDHKQVLHMYLPEWNDDIFIGGSEAATKITDRPDASSRFHYNMIFADPEPLEEVISGFAEFKFREWTESDQAGCGGQWHFEYPGMSAGRFNELITAVKEKGGMFVIPHPSSTNETVPENAMELYFQDYVGYEVFYGCHMEDSNNWKTEANYKLWTDMLGSGARVWASAGNDNHDLPQAKCLSTVYSEEQNAHSHIVHLREGDFAAGPVGVQMCVGATPMGSTGSFENQRLVFRVGDFHQDIGVEEYTFRISLLDDKGVINTWEIKGNETLYGAMDVKADAKFYRVEVYNVTLDKLTALGNPIWNEAKYQ